MHVPASHAILPRLLMSMIVATACATVSANDALGESPALIDANDLAADVRAMRTYGQPLLILYSQAGCTWCEEARRYIVPMAADAKTGDKALYRQVNIDSNAKLIDFTGQGSSHRAFAQARKVSLTPTVVLYGPDGQAIGEPIVGMRLPDFYGQYLINAIESARRAIEANLSRAARSAATAQTDTAPATARWVNKVARVELP